MLIIAALMGLFAAKSTTTEPAAPPEPVAIESQIKQEDKPPVDVITASAATCNE
jgi:hypothetical protein